MAKDGKMSLPSVDDYKGPTVPKPTELPPPPPSGIPEIGSPYPTDGYISQHMVDIAKRADTKLTTAQAVKLRDKMRQLQDMGATLQDGSPIACKSDAIRWMIEQPLAIR
jgi:hypothetical protein